MGDILRLASKTWCEKTPRAIMYVRGGGEKNILKKLITFTNQKELESYTSAQEVRFERALQEHIFLKRSKLQNHIVPSLPPHIARADLFLRKRFVGA
jgi:hypothetical protein